MMERSVTYQDLCAFKEEYKYYKIIYIYFENREFVFRSLGRKEYNEIIAIVKDPKDLEDVICQTALLYPQDLNIGNCPLAGLPAYVSQIIIEQSNFSDIDEIVDLFNSAKQLTERFDMQCMSVIKAAMPEYAVEDLYEWTWEKLMFYTALAQKILNLTLDEKSQINLMDNRKEVKEHKEKQEALDENPEFIKSLREQQIDPMLYFNLPAVVKHNLLDEPFLGGRHWNNGGIISAIRQQILLRRHNRNAERR